MLQVTREHSEQNVQYQNEDTMKKVLPYGGLYNEMSPLLVFTLSYVPSIIMAGTGLSFLVLYKPVSLVFMIWFIAIFWIFCWFVLDYILYKSSKSTDTIKPHNQNTLSTNPEEHFKQFQPLINDSLQVTSKGNWVGYGHQDKVSFVRAVTFCNFVLENNPRILQMSKNNEDIRVKLSELPQQMSSEPIKAIRSVHYGYAYIDPSSDSMLRLSSTQESTKHRKVFPITYLAGRDIPSSDQLSPEDTSILNLTEAVKSG